MSGSNDKPMSEPCEFDFFAVFGESEQTSKPMSEQYEFDFDAPSGSDYVSATPAPEADLGTEDASVTDAEVAEVEEVSNAPAVDVDIDAPLYGAEGCDAEGWKSVDFRVDDGDADRVSQGNDGGGDGSMPPPKGPGSASGSHEKEPEHSRSTPGAPSTGLITLKSEHSEHSEHSESFSSTDFDDPDWISPIYPESMWQTLSGLGDTHCEEYTRTAVKVTALNAALFACVVILNANLHMHHAVWYIYYEMAGAWRILRKAELLNVVHRCVIAWGEKYHIFEIVKLCSRRFCGDVMSFMMPFPEYEDIFDRAPKYVINVKNGTLVIDSAGNVVQHEHSPEFLCRNTINIDYDPTVDYTEFVKEMFGDHVSPEDLDVVQKYAGQCLLGWNVTQTILLISGEGGTGKSNIVRLLEAILGRGNYEGLRTNMLDRPFETSRFDGKSLLVASDQYSDALMKKGAHMLKTLTGGDEDTTELKGENEHPMIKGVFNVIIVSNSDLALSIDGDRTAWTRRLRPIKYVGEAPKVPDRLFVEHILAKYAKQALKWMVDGAVAIRRAGDKIDPHPEMAQRIDTLVQDADAYYAFVKKCVIRTRLTDDKLLNSTLFKAFTTSDYFVGEGSKQTIQKGLRKAMMDVYGVDSRHDLKDPEDPKKDKYGYVGYRIELRDPE